MVLSSGIHPKEQQRQTSRILFGSCNSQHYTTATTSTTINDINHNNNNTATQTPIWDAMTQRNASALIWAGDAIYGDDFHPIPTSTGFWTKLWKKGTVRPATPSILNELYEQLVTDPGYRRFIRREDSNRNTTNHNMTILGVWDDHDYGVNNGDRRYMYRTESAQLYLQFLQRSNTQQPLDLHYMEQRAIAGKGLYGVKVFDFDQPLGQELLSDQEAGIEPDFVQPPAPQLLLSNRSVAIFLIDCRSNKSPWNDQFPDIYTLNYKADFLGEDQWSWLETSLRRSTASVNVIVQGLQVHADHFFDGNLVEDWSRFPTAQHRLYQTIVSSGVSAPILVSGDVHMAELLRRDCRQRRPSSIDTRSTTTHHHASYGASRMLLEVTVSGMTHSWCSNSCARPQLGKVCRNRWIQRALCAGMHWAHQTPAWTDVINSVLTPSNVTKHQLQYVLERNFGEMEFDWVNRRVLVRVFGHTGTELLNTAWPFDLLSGKVEPSPTGRLRLSDFEATYQNLYLHNVSKPEDWICLNHRGISSFGMKLFGVVSPLCVVAFLVFLPVNTLIFFLWMIWRYRNRQYRNKTKLKQM